MINDGETANGDRNRDHIYEAYKTTFKAATRRPKIDTPDEFNEDIALIDEFKFTPANQQLQLIEIEEKNDLEQLDTFNERVVLGRLRKNLLIVWR